MATTAGGLLDIASVGPLTPVCQAFKTLIEAVGGAAEAEENLRHLVSWCAFLIQAFIKLGRAEGVLSGELVRMCLRDFVLTTNQLAKRAKTLATRPKLTALLYHRKDIMQLSRFEEKLRNIWADIGVLAVLDIGETLKSLSRPGLESMVGYQVFLIWTKCRNDRIARRAVDAVKNAVQKLSNMITRESTLDHLSVAPAPTCFVLGVHVPSFLAWRYRGHFLSTN